MVVIYEFNRALEGKKPYFEAIEIAKMSPGQRMRYFMQEETMKGEYLGACLDFCRWGGQTTVKYDTDIKGLMGLIERWKTLNDSNPSLYHEREIRELYHRFELPRVNHEGCPRNQEHKGMVKDGAGRVRCAHVSTKFLKPSFTEVYRDYDSLAQMNVNGFCENEPWDPTPNYEQLKIDNDCPELEGVKYIPVEETEEYSQYLIDKRRYDEEEPVEIKDHCYAVISERDQILTLESILGRLNLSNKTHEVVFGFDGWDLAYYVQRWEEQFPDRQTVAVI